MIDSRAAGPPPSILPAAVTSFVGRERELAAIERLLRAERLLTLTGSGGSGKTRLALEAIGTVLDHFADGVVFVPLATIADPELVPLAIAQRLGIQAAGGRPVLETIVHYLRDKSLLLGLDNFEQVLGAAPIVAQLLSSCPRITVLVTSRAVLRLYGEHDFPVPPLAVPPRALPVSSSPETIADYAAVRLFIDRARAVSSEGTVIGESLQAVAEICRRLDGLPLAIELAAAHTGTMPPRVLLSRMERRMPLPDRGPRDLPARQQTLHATITWSYELLGERDRRLLRWLSAFAGGATLAAVEVVCEPLGNGTLGVIEDIRTLVDNSLLRLEEQEDGEARYWMLQTIRDFALDELEVSPEAATVRQRHAEHFVALAEEGERRLRTPDQRVWLTRLERDHDNFRAALTWSQTDGGAPSLGLRLAGALSRFWWLHGHVTEGRIWLAAGLAQGDPLDPARLKALVGAGRLAWNQGDYEQAKAFSEAASLAARATGDKFQEAEALSDLLALARTRGDVDKAAELCKSSLALYREVGHTWGICIALYWLGFMARERGDFNLAISFQEESLMLRRAAGDVWGVSWSLHDLGLVALAQGDFARAEALLEEGLRLQQELGHRRGVAWSLHDLGRLAIAVGELERAATLLSESMLLRREHSDKLGVAECLESFAALAAAVAQPERAATLFGAAEALRDALAAPLWPTDRARHDRNVAAVRTQLDSHALGKAWARGLALSPEDASTYALAQIAPLPPAGSEPRAIGEPLSLREREVVQLLVQRRTNRQIAEVLVISERTAENHVSRILGKLGLESRAQAAVWAVEQGLGRRRSE